MLLRRFGFVLLVATALLLVSCGGDEAVSDGGSGDPAELQDTVWVLSGGIDVQGWEASAPTAEFADGRISGTGGCNRYGASYELSDGRIEIGAPMATRIGCPSPVNEVETQFFAALEGVEQWRIEDGALHLSGQSPDLVFEATSLVGEWTVTSFERDNVVETLIADTEITATFAADGSLSGSGGCNIYQAGYRTEGSRIYLRSLSTTERACLSPNGVMEQEDAYLAALARVERLDGGSDGMSLLNAQGDVLVTLERAGEAG